MAIVTLLLVVFRSPAGKETAVNTYSSVTGTVQDALQNNYILSFEPTKKAKSTKEAEEMKKQLDKAVAEYKSYLENDLGSQVKDTYDSTIHGLSVQLDQTQKLLKALGKKAIGKADKHETGHQQIHLAIIIILKVLLKVVFGYISRPCPKKNKKCPRFTI